MTQPVSLLSDTFCGENTYLTSSLISWTDVITIWHNESYYFQYGDWPEKDEEKSVYHYTQVTCEQANVHIA